MEEEEPGEDRSSLRDNSMARSFPFKKGGHGTSLFCYLGCLGYLSCLVFFGYRVSCVKLN
jgi:hypothetical protein